MPIISKPIVEGLVGRLLKAEISFRDLAEEDRKLLDSVITVRELSLPVRRELTSLLDATSGDEIDVPLSVMETIQEYIDETKLLSKTVCEEGEKTIERGAAIAAISGTIQDVLNEAL